MQQRMAQDERKGRKEPLVVWNLRDSSGIYLKLGLAFDWRFQAMGLEACASATAWYNSAWYSECEDENVCSSSEFRGIDKGLKGEPTDTQTTYSLDEQPAVDGWVRVQRKGLLVEFH